MRCGGFYMILQALDTCGHDTRECHAAACSCPTDRSLRILSLSLFLSTLYVLHTILQRQASSVVVKCMFGTFSEETEALRFQPALQLNKLVLDLRYSQASRCRSGLGSADFDSCKSLNLRYSQILNRSTVNRTSAPRNS
jgi:hypothetical protein